MLTSKLNIFAHYPLPSCLPSSGAFAFKHRDKIVFDDAADGALMWNRRLSGPRTLQVLLHCFLMPTLVVFNLLAIV